MSLTHHFRQLISRKQESILGATITLAITFAISALLGVWRNRLLYSQLFSCCAAQLDAYNAAFRLPDLIFKLLVSGALSASFIPVFSSYLHRDEKAAHQIASTVINTLLLAFVVLSLTILIFARPFSTLIAPGFSPDQLQLMTQLTRILLISQIFFLLSNFVTGILQANQLFLIPSLSPIVYNLFIILGIITLTPTLGIYGVAVGTIVGAFFHLVIQLPLVYKTGYHYQTTIDWKLKGVKEIVKLMLPRTLSLGLGEIENTITLFFGSTLPVGSISLFNLSLQLMYLPSRIFGATVGQASLPILSSNIAKNEIDKFRYTVNKTILQSLFLALPVTVAILVLRLPLVRLVYGARQFPWSATLLTAKTLAYLTPAIASQAVIQILTRSFYAMHNTRTPLKVSILSLLINITSSYLFVNFTDWGIAGLAVSVSLGNVSQFLGLFTLYVRRVDGDGWRLMYFKFIKIILASLVMAVSMRYSLRLVDLFVLDTSRTLNLIFVSSISFLFGFGAYLYCCYLLNIDECRQFVQLLRRWF
jgi:putative peptidoglycan lipid II flippase